MFTGDASSMAVNTLALAGFARLEKTDAGQSSRVSLVTVTRLKRYTCREIFETQTKRERSLNTTHHTPSLEPAEIAY